MKNTDIVYKWLESNYITGEKTFKNNTYTYPYYRLDYKKASNELDLKHWQVRSAVRRLYIRNIIKFYSIDGKTMFYRLKTKNYEEYLERIET